MVKTSRNGLFKYYLDTDSTWQTKDLSFSFGSKVQSSIKNEFYRNFDWLEKYTQLDFKEATTNKGTIHIDWEYRNRNWLGWAVYPKWGSTHPNSRAGDITLNLKYERAFLKGQFDNTLSHELGHALGLEHTFDTPNIPKGLDARWNSQMSYSHRNGVDLFQPWDLEELRKNYGGEKKANLGNNTYNPHDWKGKMIVDDGGIDTLNLTKFGLIESQDIIKQVNALETKIDYGKRLDFFTLSFDTTIEKFALRDGSIVDSLNRLNPRNSFIEDKPPKVSKELITEFQPPSSVFSLNNEAPSFFEIGAFEFKDSSDLITNNHEINSEF